MDASVIDVLERATSQDASVLKVAEQTLKQWETQRGFYTALYNVYSDHSLPVNVRWMAVVHFKNGVDRYWRKMAPGAIAEDEKEFLRQRLTEKFDEPVNQLAVQIAVLIARIARFDCPNEWSTLIPVLLEVIGGQDSFAQHRAMLTLHHVIKTLASKRLLADMRLFRDLTSNIFNFILNLWNSFTESFIILASSGAEIQQIQEAMEKAKLLLKILRILTINGFKKPSQSPDAMLYLKVIFERARSSLECRKTLISRGIRMEVCDKFIIQLTKVLLGVLKNHPNCYIELIPMSLEFTVFYCFTEAGQPFTFERFIIQCMNLMMDIMLMKSYAGKCTTDSLLHEKMVQMRKDFFTDEILKEIFTRLVTHYFVLTPADLELWDSDPENFAVDDAGESWKYSLRPCSESLFQALIRMFRIVSDNVLVDLVQRHYQPVDPNDLHAILLKDAVYNAIGLAGFKLYDEINFDEWFSTTLKQELKLRDNNYRIIRRRVCWLFGQWAGIKLSRELRPELYKLLIESLSPEEDMGVRLAASNAFKSVINDFDFNKDEFDPFLEPAFAILFSLLKEVIECDTKIRVLSVLSAMIERVGSSLKPRVNSFITYLSNLWQKSNEQYMLRCTIVSTLVFLEKALGSDSVMLESLVVDVVVLSCDVNQEGHLYLLEDGLELWLALLENTPASTPAIKDLFKNMPILLDCSTENMQQCFNIIQAYVLLNPLEFLCEYGPGIVDVIQGIISDLRCEGVAIVMEFFETCLIAAPEQGAQLIKPFLRRIFENIFRETSHSKVMALCLSIMARLLLSSKDMFAQVISDLARDIGSDTTEESVLNQIMDVWLGRMAAIIINPEKRKLLALALCSLLSPNSPPIIFQQFPNIILNIVETLNDIMDIDDSGCPTDTLMGNYIARVEQYEEFDYKETEHEQRKRKLDINDPVFSVCLKDMLLNQLITLQRAIGDEQLKQMFLMLHTDVEQQLKKYVTL